jgi:hypothetical protein
LEASFVSFWSGVEKEPQEFVLLEGNNSNNNNNKEKKGKGEQEQGEQGEQCTLSFLCLLCVRSCCCSGAKLVKDDESGGKQVR